MDQIKIGAFLKVLRKEKNLTQEQLAEQLGVSGRTVSRWETGNNMPDISLLVEIAEFYEVTIPELINGERKSETMNENEKEVATTMADYATEEKSEILKSIQNVLPVHPGSPETHVDLRGIQVLGLGSLQSLYVNVEEYLRAL